MGFKMAIYKMHKENKAGCAMGTISQKVAIGCYIL